MNGTEEKDDPIIDADEVRKENDEMNSTKEHEKKEHEKDKEHDPKTQHDPTKVPPKPGQPQEPKR
jgi:hypothetical protein